MPINISGTVFHMPIIFINREEAAPRFETCGKCGENKEGKCQVNGEPIKSFIYYELSGCPLNYWPELDLGRITARQFFGCCG